MDAGSKAPGATVAGIPSPTVLASLKARLQAYPPFSGLAEAELDLLFRGAAVAYFEPGQVVFEPGSVPNRCYVVTQGSIVGERPQPGAGEFGTVWAHTAGDLFPLGALVAQRPVGSRYRADRDTFCLALRAASFAELFRVSPKFADFCTRRLGHLLDLSMTQAQAVYLSESTSTLGLATRLGNLVRRAPVSCAAGTPLQVALAEMDARKVGSMPVLDQAGRPLGIFTQQDVIARVVLPQIPLSTPISSVMSSPVLTLPVDATAGDAVMMMARHAVRHVVVVDGDRLAGVVSERDLFALQRLSSRQVSTAIRRAREPRALAQAAADIRALARNLVAQGVAAGQLTRLLADLNDQLTVRLLDLVAPSHDVSGIEACWLALGSEGRNEQTIATDQDNALIFVPRPGDDGARERLIAFAREVNEQLDACGYPLCKGHVMASNPRWCATQDEWRAVFANWIDRGDPEALLAANIFFDFRPLWGAHGLAEQLRGEIAESAKANRRFLKQMSDNALRNRPPLGLFGAFRTVSEPGGEASLDLKLNGAAPIVDAARIYALAGGIVATNTVERLRGASAHHEIPEVEVAALCDAFDFIQLARLRGQLRERKRGEDNPNRVAVRDLGEIDRHVLKEAFRHVRRIQHRLQLDYPG